MGQTRKPLWPVRSTEGSNLSPSAEQASSCVAAVALYDTRQHAGGAGPAVAALPLGRHTRASREGGGVTRGRDDEQVRSVTVLDFDEPGTDGSLLLARSSSERARYSLQAKGVARWSERPCRPGGAQSHANGATPTSLSRTPARRTCPDSRCSDRLIQRRGAIAQTTRLQDARTAHTSVWRAPPARVYEVV
jgi:hypothetical protein